MKRLHVHVSVDDLAQSTRFYSACSPPSPVASMQAIENPTLADMAAKVRQMLLQVIDGIGRPEPNDSEEVAAEIKTRATDRAARH